MYSSAYPLTFVFRASPTLFSTRSTQSASSAKAFEFSHQDSQFSPTSDLNKMDCVLAHAAIGLLLGFSFMYLCLLGYSAATAAIEEALIEPVDEPDILPVVPALDHLIDLVNQLDIESPIVDPIAKPIIDPAINDLIVCFSKLSIRQSCFKAPLTSATANHLPRVYPANRHLGLVPALKPAPAVKKSLRFRTVSDRPDVDICDMHLFAVEEGALKQKTPAQSCCSHFIGAKFVVFPANRAVLLKELGTFDTPKKQFQSIFRPLCKTLRHQTWCSDCHRWRHSDNNWETVEPASPASNPVKLCISPPKPERKKPFMFN